MSTIALVGSGEYLEATRSVDEHLLELIDHGRVPRVVCLPTASSTEGEVVWRGWGTRGVAWFTSLGAEATTLDVIDRASADDADHAAAVAAADLVYLSGGQPTHLHRTLVGTRVWAAIEDLVARGGILAGCSAGAMIQGAEIAPLRGGSPTPGFGLLADTIVIPHFDEFPALVQPVVDRLVGRGTTVIGIDGGTALVRHVGALRAIGSGRVSIWGPRGYAAFTDSPIEPDWIGRT